MARQRNGKLKILYIKDILERETRAGRSLTMRELIERLGEYGVTAERKSVGSDLEALRAYGIPVERTRQGRGSAYSIRQNP
jgi:predicted DNA-binding transcriptional regulator YafY